MLDMVRGEARRHPGRFPWIEATVVALVLLAVVGIVVGALVLATDLFSGRDAPPTVVQSGQQPAAQPVQPVPEVLAPVAPVVVDYRVVWTEVQGFDPSTIPVEEGLYNGAITYNTSPGINPNDPTDIPEMTAYAWKILPQLEGERTLWNKSINLAAARDQGARDIVLVSIIADHTPPWYILLSVDGEKSWCMLNLLPDAYRLGERPLSHEYPRLGDATMVRVVTSGDEIHLYGLDARPGIHWWTATVKRNELPCS